MPTMPPLTPDYSVFADKVAAICVECTGEWAGECERWTNLLEQKKSAGEAPGSIEAIMQIQATRVPCVKAALMRQKVTATVGGEKNAKMVIIGGGVFIAALLWWAFFGDVGAKRR